MRGKKTARYMSYLAVFMVVPAFGAAAGAQAGEQVEAKPAPQGITFAQAEMAGPGGPYGPAAGAARPQGMTAFPGVPWSGPQGGGPGQGFGPGPQGPYGLAGPGMMQGQGGPAGPMRGGRAFGMRSIMQALHLPNLSEEQRGELQSLAQSLRKKHWDLKGAMMEESDKLGQVWSAEPVDANAVGEAYGRLFDLQRQWIVSAVETRRQVDDLLTDEQKQLLRGGPARLGGAFPMMSPGGMRPGMQGAPEGGAPAPQGSAPGSATPEAGAQSTKQ